MHSVGVLSLDFPRYFGRRRGSLSLTHCPSQVELDPEHAFCLHGLQGSQTSIRIPDDDPVVVVVAVVVTVVDVVVVVDVDVVVAVGVVPIVVHYVYV